MKPYWEQDGDKIYLGHVLEVLKELPDESAHCCVTSPPYWGLRDYGLEPQIWDGDPDCEHDWIDNERVNVPSGMNPGEKAQVGATKAKIQRFVVKEGFCQKCGAWKGSLGLEPTPEFYISHLVQIFREVRRVLRNDGTLWLNLGDSYASQGGECSNRYFDGRKDEFGPGNRPRGSSKMMRNSGLKPKDLVGIPWRVALALQADGWWLRSDIIWHKPNPMPESVTDRPTKAHEYIFLLSKNQKYYYDNEAIKEETITFDSSIRNRDITKLNNTPGRTKMGGLITNDYNQRNKRSVWTIPTRPFSGAHFAVFPPALIEPCILAGTSEKGCCGECGAPIDRITESEYKKHRPSGGKKSRIERGIRIHDGGYGNWGTFGTNLLKQTKTIGWQPTCKCNAETKPCIVLDFFGGSGTTAEVAHKFGRKFILIELSKPYLDDIAIPRIERETAQMRLFN